MKFNEPRRRRVLQSARCDGGKRVRPARFEHLEDRRTLAVAATLSAAGELHFVGDGGDDVLELFVDAGIVKYTGATPALNPSVAAITALTIDLGDGANS